MLSAARLYFHTLRHLRVSQIAAQVRHRVSRPDVAPAPCPPPASIDGAWLEPPARRPTLIAPSRVRLLNVEQALRFPESWATGAERLWLYNLHYFEDLTAERAADRRPWHTQLVERWIRENEPGRAPGWEPYPISLRAVNWIKWALNGAPLSSPALASLASQLRHLEARLEWHLLANHLFANAKALFFGGTFFSGEEAKRWRNTGARILARELDEQVLPDGGHFERSPMYHALALEDVLDLLNLMAAYPAAAEAHRELRSRLRQVAGPMLSWLETLCHPDGDIAFFNDAAFGVALPAKALRDYGERLGVVVERIASPFSRDLSASGYARLEQGDWCAMVDAAAVGPDYQPGHAHADTLSFELSLAGERIFSNSGTSTYEIGPQRSYERSTRAHNTVEIDREDSTEVWAAFRVARRARPFSRGVTLNAKRSSLACSHDGYGRLRGGPVHRRMVEVHAARVDWVDTIEGAGRHLVRGYIPLHPGVQADLRGSTVHLTTPNRVRLQLRIDGAPIAETVGSHAAEFGLRKQRSVLMWERNGLLPVRVALSLARTAG